MTGALGSAACESPPIERPYMVVSSSPANGERDVETTTVPTVSFDVPLDPSVVGPDLIALHTGELRPGGRVRYSVVDRTATFTPAVALRTSLAYVVTLDPDVRGMDGSVPAGRFEATFVTGTTGTARPAETPPPEFDTEVAPILEGRCVPCHSGPSPAAGLALAPAVDAAGAVTRASREWLGWRIVAPGAPERSYLLYKIVGSPGIVGDRMPPDGTLDVDQARLLERWIAAGAHAGEERP